MLEFVNRFRPSRPARTAGLAALAVLAVAGAAWAANEGTVTSLSATDAPTFNETIAIAATFLANEKVNNTNAYYEIIAPDGVTVVATHSTDVPPLEAGQSYSDSWATTNSSFPGSGTYTLRVCWSPGGSQNCSIDSRGWVSTSFYSVPTLGLGLALAGVALLGWFLWRRRADFSKPQVGAPPEAAARPGKTAT